MSIWTRKVFHLLSTFSSPTALLSLQGPCLLGINLGHSSRPFSAAPPGPAFPAGWPRGEAGDLASLPNLSLPESQGFLGCANLHTGTLLPVIYKRRASVVAEVLDP